jgi:mono/diheme cytochrome c family protein
MFDPPISNDTRRGSRDFTGNNNDINLATRHGFINMPHISNVAWEEIMYGLIRCLLTIAASCCVAMLLSERAFALVPTKAPNGDLFVVDAMFGAVHVIRVLPGRAKPVRDEVFAGGLKQPFGIAFYPLGSHPRWVYLANSDGVVRFRYRSGDLKATGKPEQIIAGSPTIHRYARDVVATGLRNCEGMTVQPATGELSCIVNERDEPGDTPDWAPLQNAVYSRDNSSRSYIRAAAATGEPLQSAAPAGNGQALYIVHCAACHQSTGEGLPGVFPPLKGSGVVNKDDASKHIQVVLNGMQGGRAGGVVYAAPMPPFAGTLNDSEIAGIIDFERSSWGNHGTPVTAVQVGAERARAR